MDGDRIAVAGAGIAGLTAALALARKGFSVTVLERAERLEETGAGLQLSPNATRILRSLGVLDRLEKDAVRPEAVVLRDAASLSTVARVPLSQAAASRWGGPYVVAHRADLQKALLSTVADEPGITLQTGVEVRGVTFGSGVAVRIEVGGRERKVPCRLLVGADGVWSGLRPVACGSPSRFTGHVAFRTVLHGETAGMLGGDILSRETVTAFLAPGFHLVAYPLRAGAEINLVAVTKGPDIPRGWASAADTALLLHQAANATPALSAVLREAAPWTAWPVHAVDRHGPWTHPGGLVLVGDAAHALTPYAAQGAAMAIEDAVVLAALAARESDTEAMLRAFEHIRKPRVARVAGRGDFNRLVWHAAGPLAFARNLVLRLKSGESLASDLDWLYGYDAEAAVRHTLA